MPFVLSFSHYFSEHEDDSTLADDYLISCLIESNTLRNLERVTEGCQTQVGEVFAATEKTRSGVTTDALLYCWGIILYSESLAQPWGW